MSNRLIRSVLSYIILELRMILRNKKPLNNLYQIFLIYLFSVCVLIYAHDTPLKDSLVFLMIMSLMSSSFILGHGIFLLTWESTYFSFFMTRKISLQDFFKSKMLLFIISSIVFSFTSIPVILIFKWSLLMYLSFLIFNIGLIPILVITVSLFNNERASLEKGVFFNYEGYGLWQYLIFIAELMLPGVIYLVVSRIWSVSGALFILFFIGSLGMIILMVYPSLFFNKRKYRIIKGFIQK